MEHDVNLSQWWTPRTHARSTGRQFAHRLAGARVLEPSAGRGVFVDVALEHGAALVVAVERDARLVRELQRKYRSDDRVLVMHGAFVQLAADDLRFVGAFDVVLGNPPYDNGQDTEHLAAWNGLLSESGRAIGLLRLHALATKEKWLQVWSRAVIEDVVVYVRRISFSGTAGSARQLEFATLAWRLATPAEMRERPPLDAAFFEARGRLPDERLRLLTTTSTRLSFAF